MFENFWFFFSDSDIKPSILVEILIGKDQTTISLSSGQKLKQLLFSIFFDYFFPRNFNGLERERFPWSDPAKIWNFWSILDFRK